MIFPPSQTLQEWRNISVTDGKFRAVWTPLEPFFVSKGYTLFISTDLFLKVTAPNSEERTNDGYAYKTPYNNIGIHASEFDMGVSINFREAT